MSDPPIVDTLDEAIFDFLEGTERDIEKTGKLFVSAPAKALRNIPPDRRCGVAQVFARSEITLEDRLLKDLRDFIFQTACELPADEIAKMFGHVIDKTQESNPHRKDSKTALALFRCEVLSMNVAAEVVDYCDRTRRTHHTCCTHCT